MKVLIYVAVMMILIAPAMLIQGVVLSDFWSWFIMTAFDAPYLGIGPAIGVSMTVSLFIRTNTSSDDDDDEPDIEKAAMKVLGAVALLLAVWGIGSIVAGIVY